jgi:hypothetical protein
VESATAKAKKKQAEKVKTKRGQTTFFQAPKKNLVQFTTGFFCNYSSSFFAKFLGSLFWAFWPLG